MTSAIAYRRLRAPREHGHTLIEPALGEAPRIVEANRKLAREAYGSLEFGGASWSELTQQARRDLLDLAFAHSSWQRCDVPLRELLPVEPPLLLSGHQPELFHPGVWFKNFLLSSLARRMQATPVNLIVDNDTVSNASIRVLRGRDEQARIETVPLDDEFEELPYEERRILDPAKFLSFAQRVDPHGEALVTRLWSHLPPLADDTNLGATIAAARCSLECEHGVKNWEVPLSKLCHTRPFAQFALHLLSNTPRFVAVYNTSLDEYRAVHKIRSQSHPVPELKTHGPWQEVPFWVWTHDKPRRRPLFVKLTGDTLSLSDLDLCQIELPLQGGRVTSATHDAWRVAAQQGIKIRPRALVTTMFARLLLCDLFLHGIGGAKYDQLTDAIIERFFRIPPPAFLAVTATVQLVPCQPHATATELQQLEHDLRELPYHPDVVLRDAADATVCRLLAERARWIDLQLPKGQRRARHEAITDLNARLAAYSQGVARVWEHKRTELTTRLRHEQLVASREFSFCLYDDRLPELLLKLAEHPR